MCRCFLTQTVYRNIFILFNDIITAIALDNCSYEYVKNYILLIFLNKHISMMHDETEIIILGKSYLKCSTDGRKQYVSTYTIIFDVHI